MKDEYDKQATAWLNKAKGRITTKFVGTKAHFFTDTEEKIKRDVYKVEITTKHAKMTLYFGDSIHNTRTGEHKGLSDYSVLSCLQGYELGSFDNFCDDFGYSDLPLSKASEIKEVYHKCLKEYEGVLEICGDDDELLQELQEIQ